MRATVPNGHRPRRRRFWRAATLGKGAARRRRNDERTVNGRYERMDKRLLGWCRRVWQRMSALDRTVAILLAVFLLLLALVAFGSDDNCGCHCICWLLGVTKKTEAINKLGLAIAGIVAFWGVAAANRRSDAIEAGNRQRAFKDGVEHLGNDKPSVRQGGAHALFHLALEDDKLSASITGVLCAHIRETTGDKDYQEEYKDKPSTEMQSLLRLLFTTETVNEKRLTEFWQDVTPDLNGGYFCGVKLENARFRGAKLRSAQFQRASLEDAQFQGASLEKAQFQRALLWRAQFQGAELNLAQFQGAGLVGAQFQRATPLEAQFQGATLWEAQFQRASLVRAQFQGASLEKARFQRASLQLAQFQGASLGQAWFQGASLDLAQFQGASLWAAQFQGASLESSQFQGAMLYKAGFQQAKFRPRSEDEYKDSAIAMLTAPSQANLFCGISSSKPLNVSRKFAERIDDRTDEESDFSGVAFSGGMTKELWAEVKQELEKMYWPPDDIDFKEKLIRDLESEIGQPESNEPPQGVVAGSYGKEVAERWIKEFREAMATVPETNQAA